MTASPAEPFSVVKWYLDCTDPDGRSAICYWVSVAWRGFALTWHSVDLYEPGSPPHRASLTSVPPPTLADGRITWSSPVLRCMATVEPRNPPLSAVLFQDDTGHVHWHCDAPIGLASIAVAGHAPVCGSGYAEHLEMTVAPWHLPITELRWGRWGDADTSRSLVWIDWRGKTNRAWAFLDGHEQDEIHVSDTTVSVGDTTLTLERHQTLVHRGLSDLLDPIPALRAVLPASLLKVSETKWRGTGTLSRPGSAPVTAPAVYEMVRLG
ncbi:MAG: hypothetical protein EXR93_05840 [Gemmatimonadetes bacterium]|nr:hypothetical protein [Gemmatimonadota bacterium]